MHIQGCSRYVWILLDERGEQPGSEALQERLTIITERNGADPDQSFQEASAPALAEMLQALTPGELPQEVPIEPVIVAMERFGEQLYNDQARMDTFPKYALQQKRIRQKVSCWDSQVAGGDGILKPLAQRSADDLRGHSLQA